MAIKIIPDGDADLEASVAALEAAWLNGATGVTIERRIPVVVEMNVIAGEFRNTDCNECVVSLCTVECQRMKRISRLRDEYSALEEKLHEAGKKLHEAIIHD